ncbi:MAG: hypothetical protein ACO3IB_00870 [Phycisphaerales bacterium]
MTSPRTRGDSTTASTLHARAGATCLSRTCAAAALLPAAVASQSGTTPPTSTGDAGKDTAPAGGSSTTGATAPVQPADPSRKSADDTAPRAPQASKSLDDLLGVPTEAGDRSAEDAAEREQAERLQRSLDEASLQDLVTRALDGMKNASGRLSDQRDAGIGTQRIQEDVVLTLDRLLEEAQRQQQKSKSSSSSSSRSQKQQKSDPSEQSQQQSQQRQRSQRQQGQQSGDNQSGEAEPPPMEEGTADGGELSESRIEWGRLPERVRDLVLQGRRDKVSSLYERLTREYYRRLAEEASK